MENKAIWFMLGALAEYSLLAISYTIYQRGLIGLMAVGLLNIFAILAFFAFCKHEKI